MSEIGFEFCSLYRGPALEPCCCFEDMGGVSVQSAMTTGAAHPGTFVDGSQILLPLHLY